MVSLSPSAKQVPLSFSFSVLPPFLFSKRQQPLLPRGWKEEEKSRICTCHISLPPFFSTSPPPFSPLLLVPFCPPRLASRKGGTVRKAASFGHPPRIHTTYTLVHVHVYTYVPTVYTQAYTVAKQAAIVKKRGMKGEKKVTGENDERDRSPRREFLLSSLHYIRHRSNKKGALSFASEEEETPLAWKIGLVPPPSGFGVRGNSLPHPIIRFSARVGRRP